MRLDPGGLVAPDEAALALTAVAMAEASLAKDPRGALIVIVRRNAIGESITGGIPFDAGVSAELIESVF